MQVTLQNHRTYIPPLLLLVFTIAISRNNLWCQRGIISNNPDTTGRKWDYVEDKKRARLVWRRYVQCPLPNIAHDCPRQMRNSLIWKIWAWARLSRGLGHCQRLGGRVLLRVISENHRIYLEKITDLRSSHFIHITLFNWLPMSTWSPISPWSTWSLWSPCHSGYPITLAGQYAQLFHDPFMSVKGV